MDTEQRVSAHYTSGDLEERILARLRATGRDPDRFAPEDLAGADQLHIGGVQAARDIARGAGIGTDSRVLDLGSGIGGPARVFAQEFGAAVHGVDLTPEFVRVARSLTRRCGLSDRVAFSEGSILALPFGAAEFDTATLVHVGMNIKDKRRLFAEVSRVLKSGGVFAVYDIMRLRGGELPFPLPWATDGKGSFVETPDTYTGELADAGFEVQSQRNRQGFAIEVMERQAGPAGNGPSSAPLRSVAGPEALARMDNLLAAFRQGILAPVEVFSRLSGES